MALVAQPSSFQIAPAGLEHLRRVAHPALVLAPTGFVDDIAVRLAHAGIQDAVARRDSAPVFDWLMTLVALQGISDEVAFGWDERHGGVQWAQIDTELRAYPSCPRLRSYWHFEDCGYRKRLGTCAEPKHLPQCPLPHLNLRKGSLNQSAFHLALFIRDVCGGDLVGWLDARLAEADPGLGAPNRAAVLGIAVSAPLTGIHSTGPKLWPMMLGELLLVGDPDRERWVTAGAGQIAVDSLVHNFLHRTGTLRRCGAEHVYGPACYACDGCADILRAFSETVDARQFDPTYPAVFPRFLQHCLWRFCAADGLNICNGNRVDDRFPCWLKFCPAGPDCDRVALR